MKRLIMASAALALLASPALAQSYNPGYGTGNSIVAPPSWQAQNKGAVAADASRAFAYVPAPERSYGANLNGPASTGAGSVGYNDKLLHD